MKNIKPIFLYLFLLITCLVSGEEIISPVHFDKKVSRLSFISIEIKDNQIESFLNQGIRAFIIDGKNKKSGYNDIFSQCYSFLKSNKQSVIFIILKNESKQNDISGLIQKNHLNDYLFSGKAKISDISYKDLIRTNKRLIVFSDKFPENFISLKNTLFFTQFDSIFNQRKAVFNDNQSKLICYNPYPENSDKFSADSLTNRTFYLWIRLGQFPNFVAAKPGNIKIYKDLSDSLNKSTHYSGKVTCDNHILDNLHWKFNKIYCESNGTFSFPGLKSDYCLYVPWKEGFKFYPEVIKFDENNRHYDLTATRLKLSDQLIFHLKFENEAYNEADNTSDAQLFQMKFRDADEHGQVAYFKHKQSGIQLNKLNNFNSSKAFTISAWVKPFTTKRIQTILSKGEVFSAKIRYEDLSFAGTTFNSKISSAGKIKSNNWQHICYVYVPNYHLQFFINGKIIFEDEMKQMPDNEQSLVIGNNFSNEYFEGEMDDVRVWNRALSKEEIEQLYELKTNQNHPGILFFTLIPVLIFIVFYFIIKKRKKTKEVPENKLTNSIISSNENTKNCIHLFGNFSIYNQNCENLTKQLTPKVKQLLILLIINRNGVTIQTINEMLWPGTEEEKAKQNRNYSIQQIKKTIQNFEGVQLIYKSKHWKLDISEDIYLDYYRFETISNELLSSDNLNPAKIREFIHITERGKFLLGTDAEIFDAIKSKTADLIIEQMLKLANLSDNKLKIRIGNILLIQDSLSEEGLRLSVKSLFESGRKGEANDIYLSFIKRYQKIYKEDFSVKFQDLI